MSRALKVSMGATFPSSAKLLPLVVSSSSTSPYVVTAATTSLAGPTVSPFLVWSHIVSAPQPTAAPWDGEVSDERCKPKHHTKTDSSSPKATMAETNLRTNSHADNRFNVANTHEWAAFIALLRKLHVPSSENMMKLFSSFHTSCRLSGDHGNWVWLYL